ncbi:hypothetical protein NXX23_10500 [Bacteroides ovatus]|nr:hypothetical protein [Bacteroides ovatus]
MQKAKKNYENAMKKWQKNGSKVEDKPEEFTPKAPAQIKAMYPLVKDEDIRIMISEMNNTSVKWNKRRFC